MNTEEQVVVNQENINEESVEGQEINEDSVSLESLAAKIVSEMKAADELSIQARLKARRVGELLCEAKKLIKHGEWEAWLLKNCELSKRRTQQYMQYYNSWDELETLRAEALKSAEESRAFGYGVDQELRALAFSKKAAEEQARIKAEQEVKEGKKEQKKWEKKTARLKEKQKKAQKAAEAARGDRVMNSHPKKPRLTPEEREAAKERQLEEERKAAEAANAPYLEYQKKKAAEKNAQLDALRKPGNASDNGEKSDEKFKQLKKSWDEFVITYNNRIDDVLDIIGDNPSEFTREQLSEVLDWASKAQQEFTDFAKEMRDIISETYDNQQGIIPITAENPEMTQEEFQDRIDGNQDAILEAA